MMGQVEFPITALTMVREKSVVSSSQVMQR